MGRGSLMTHILASPTWGLLVSLWLPLWEGVCRGALCQPGGCSSLRFFFTTLSRLSRLKQLEMNHHSAIILASPRFLAYCSGQPAALTEAPRPPSAGICCACGPPWEGGLHVSIAHWGAVTMTGTEGSCECGSKCLFKVCASEKLLFTLEF